MCVKGAGNKIFKYHARFLISEGWDNEPTSERYERNPKISVPMLFIEFWFFNLKLNCMS